MARTNGAKTAGGGPDTRPPGTGTRRPWAAVLVLALVIYGAYSFMSPDAPVAESDETLIVAVEYGDIENAIPAPGILQPREIVPVGARTSGQLVEIHFDVGDLVEHGDIVARIDASEQELRVRSSELSLENQRNQLEQAELELRNAARDYDRALELFEAEAYTEQERENAENRLLGAETRLRELGIRIQQGETNLEQEKVKLNYTQIRAPLAGTIISLDQKEGATLNATRTAPTVMQIADLTTLTVETEISEADIPALHTGVNVYFTTPSTGSRRWWATLRKIDPVGSVANNIVQFRGSFDIDNSDGQLLPNMTADVFLVTSSASNVLTVPVGALTLLGQGNEESKGRALSALSAKPRAVLSERRHATVELVLPDGSTEERTVIVGAMDAINAEIVAGLRRGDQVISRIVEIEDETDAVTSASRW